MMAASEIVIATGPATNIPGVGRSMPRFFFSYSRESNDDALRQFFTDLSKEVDGLTGDTGSGYFDQAEHEPGDVWEESLEKGLSTARVFVAVLTANYCDKPYCGKEWAAFADRQERYRVSSGTVDDPGLMLPLLWIPRRDRRPWPETVQQRHFHIGDPAADVNVKGLRYLVQLRQRFAKEYLDVLRALAERIVDLSVEHRGIDDQAQVLNLATVQPAFPDPMALPAPAQGSGPTHVHFVYATPAPLEAHAAGVADVRHYGAAGGREWQPYGADGTPMGVVAPNVATSDALKMIPDTLPFAADLPQRVRDLEARNELVVMLLDRWSTRVAGRAATLRAFDQNNYINCGVLVPTPDDPAAPQLTQSLAQVMRHRVSSGGWQIRCHGLDTQDAFRHALHEVLVRLRNEVIANAQPAPAGLPASAPKPMVTADGGGL